MNGIFIIAHAPLASALRQCVLHVFPDNAPGVAALDVQPNMPPEETLAQARIMLAQLGTSHALVLVDVFAALGLGQVASFQAAMAVLLCCCIASYGYFLSVRADNSVEPTNP